MLIRTFFDMVELHRDDKFVHLSFCVTFRVILTSSAHGGLVGHLDATYSHKVFWPSGALSADVHAACRNPALYDAMPLAEHGLAGAAAAGLGTAANMNNLADLPRRRAADRRGEPTLVPDLLEEIVALARRAGFGRILVQTNGIAIDARFLALVRDNRLGVGVSLGGPAEINDALQGRTAEVLAGLRYPDAAGIGFGITKVLTRDSVAALPRLAMLLAGLSGVRSMVGCGGDRTGAYCPAERGAAVVLVPSGALYPCASVAGDPDYACGSAGRPDFAALARGLRAPDDSCAGCTLAGCRGRCPARALLSPRAAGLDCVLRRGTDRQAAESARHG